jgi:DNA modification methylase
MNTLYYGDNLDILRRYIKDESIDLIYLDPPFNSNATYNVLFGEKDGTKAEAQIQAFDDTWHWDTAASEAFQEVVEFGGNVSRAMQSFRVLLGDNDMLAYLAMMAPRLVELHRVLRPTGSIYLHCDPTASHYLKVLLDSIFGVKNFKNEIIWKRQTPSGFKGKSSIGQGHDVILYFSKSHHFLYNPLFIPYSDNYLENRFSKVDETGRRFKDQWLGTATTQETIDRLKAEGKIYYTSTGKLRIKLYIDEIKGVPLDDVWNDVTPINSMAKERLGYPTQKPEALLERIIKASSNKGDLILDPFCGCGTAVTVAQRLDREWIGIDITHLAINLMKTRLQTAFGDQAKYKVIGEPVSLDDARALAESDKYQFQWWALGLVGARPTDQKKGSDKGIDGRLYFHEIDKGETKQVIISVKGGGTTVSQLRDLRGTIDRENAEIGVLITMEEPTQPMRAEVASAGYYMSPIWGNFPRLQILTIQELLEGKGIAMPPISQVSTTFKKAPKANNKKGDQAPLFPGNNN